MMIYKYPLTVTEEQYITLPKDSVLLQPQYQGDKLYVWAVVNTQLPLVSRKIIVAPTGAELWFSVYKSNYLGTVQQGSFVWHIFDGGVV